MLPLIETWQRGHPFAEIIPVSAITGTNCDRLLDLLVRRLPEHPPFFPPDATSDQPETFFVAERIREKVFHLTREEEDLLADPLGDEEGLRLIADRKSTRLNSSHDQISY